MINEIISDDTRYVHWNSVMETLYNSGIYGIPWEELESLPHINVNNKKDQVN